MKKERPSFQFYPSDWLSDSALRNCKIAARGAWIDLLCLMHEGHPYGHLTLPNGMQYSRKTLVNLLQIDSRTLVNLLAELQEKCVISRTPAGVYYSKRMVEDGRIRSLRAQNGHRGGRPLYHPIDKAKPKQKITPSSSSSSSSSKRLKETTKDSGATNAPVSAKPPHVEFCDRFKEAYESMTSQPYQHKKEHFIIADRLIKAHGLEAVTVKAKVLGILCRDRIAWFTKGGWSDFSIEKLYSQWNLILSDFYGQREAEVRAEIKKKEADRERSNQIVERDRQAVAR